MKKFLSAFLAFAMVLSMLWIPAVAGTSGGATEEVISPTEDNSVLPTYSGTGTQSLTDTYNDCLLLTVKGTTQSAFNTYLQTTLPAAGYEAVVNRAVLGTTNKASIYQNGDYVINALYIPAAKSIDGVNEAKITIEPLRGTDLTVFDSSKAYNPTKSGSVKSLLIQVGLDNMTVTDAETGAFTDAGEKNCMSYLYRLADGSFFVIDGGGNNYTGDGDLDKNHAARLYHTMVKYNKTANGGKGGNVVIAGWYITHPHTDHMGAFMAFTRTYVNNPTYGVTLEKVISYMPNIKVQSYKLSDSDTYSLSPSKVATYNAQLEKLRIQGVDIYKAHVGQMYYIRNLTVEILFTYDLLSPTVPEAFYPDGEVDPYYYLSTDSSHKNGVGNGGILNSSDMHDFTNTFSVCCQATLNVDNKTSYKAIWMGDQTCFGIETMNKMYAFSLKSDFVQVPHHGSTQMSAPKITAHSSCDIVYHGNSNGIHYSYYHQEQVNRFFGMVSAAASSSKNGHYTEENYPDLYDADGYGYVRAKYIMWPASTLVSANLDDIDGTRNVEDDSTNSRLTTWSPVIHLQVEANYAGGDAYIARYYLTVFNFTDLAAADAKGSTYTPTFDKTVITPTMEVHTGGGAITTAADLAAMASTGEYYLTNDITITDPTTRVGPRSFSGTLDGQGYTITVEYTTDNGATLFDAVQDGFLFYELSGTVKNLTIDGARVTAQGSVSGQYGILTRRATGTLVVENVHIINAKLSDSVSGNANVGGFIGDANGSSLTIKDSSFEGTLTGKHQMGGLLGRAGTGSGTVSIENCIVKGSVSGATAGGFIALVTTTGAVTLNDCVVHATVTSTATPSNSFVANGTATVGAGCHDLSAYATYQPTVLYGASIRLASGEDALKQGGIRYQLAVDKNALDAYTAAGYTVSLGSLMVRTDKLTAAGITNLADVTIENLKAKNIAYSPSEATYSTMLSSGKLRQTSGGGWYYTAALLNLTPEQYTMEVNCVGYIVLEMDGVETVIYSTFEEGMEGNTRSVQQVASRALDDHLDPASSTQYTDYLDLLYAYAGREAERENKDDQTHSASGFLA
ncbi:MAG: MBL fold metallo-hydrolase [Clostridia bacterium]|nr:MBL fold metallo-hydrolase [Clostridia bacterium]